MDKTFIDGGPARNICGARPRYPRDVADSIYEEINAFANYATQGPRCGLRRNLTSRLPQAALPQEYMAALLSSVLSP